MFGLAQKMEDDGKRREVLLKRRLEQATRKARAPSSSRPPRPQGSPTKGKSRVETAKAVEAVASRLKKTKSSGSMSPALSKLQRELEVAVSNFPPYSDG